MYFKTIGIAFRIHVYEFSKLTALGDGSDELLTSAGYLSKEEENMYERVISAIIQINADIPM